MRLLKKVKMKVLPLILLLAAFVRVHGKTSKDEMMFKVVTSSEVPSDFKYKPVQYRCPKGHIESTSWTIILSDGSRKAVCVRCIANWILNNFPEAFLVEKP